MDWTLEDDMDGRWFVLLHHTVRPQSKTEYEDVTVCQNDL